MSSSPPIPMDASNSFSKCAKSLALAPRSHIISGEVSKGPSASVKSSAAAHAESDIGLEETGELGDRSSYSYKVHRSVSNRVFGVIIVLH